MQAALLAEAVQRRHEAAQTKGTDTPSVSSVMTQVGPGQR
jgi:hypothetical protein